MEKPIYVNAFSVSTNADSDEMAMTFFHDYQDPEDYNIKEDGKVELEAKREFVCSVVMTYAKAQQLIDVFNQISQDFKQVQ